MPPPRFYKIVAAALTLLAMLAACRQEIVPEPYLPSSAHDAYRHGLEQAGLADTALGRDWLTAARQALQTSIKIELPFAEVRHVDAAEPFAVAYGFEVERGQRVEVAVDFLGKQQTRLFIDLFRVTGTDPEKWLPVASADEEEQSTPSHKYDGLDTSPDLWNGLLRLEMEPRRNGVYAVRLQSELLRGGRCQIAIRKVPCLEFPVAGKGTRAIGSGFGAPRDGGSRQHMGVDIFAARHTPVLSPARAHVHHVGSNSLGGRCIWLYDSQRSHYYYLAHLETWEVVERTWIDEGEMVATVGNSGNARTTPPHLHFAIWSRRFGYEDPQPFLSGTRAEPLPITGNPDLLGCWVHARSQRNQLPTAMLVVAVVADRYRVRLPSGTIGTVPAIDVEAADDETG
jgi:murein DD-endopeptidase MepM/ murein hydrolase activator NlpD